MAATLTIPVGGFKLSDLFDAMTQTTLASTTSTTALFKFSPAVPAGIVLTGTGFVADGAGGLSAGTIARIDYIGFEGTTLWSMQNLTGFSVTAYNTAADALALQNEGQIRAMLAANAWNTFGSFTSDEIIGGGAADTLRGGLGNDVLVGRQGTDLIIGGPHTGVLADDLSLTDYDTVDYSQENGTQAITVDLNLTSGQVIDTFGAADTVLGIELVIGTSRVDTMRGNSSVRYEAFTGGDGADTIDGRGGVSDEVRYDKELGTQGIVVDLDATSATQGTGKDTFGNLDTLINIERVRGTSFADEIHGSAADNRYMGLLGNDTLDGAAGSDWVRYDLEEQAGGADGVRVNLATGIARDGFKTFDTLISIENVRGTDFYDRLIGSTANNVLEGQGGGDFISGGVGNDTLRGGSGGDLLQGGFGNDLLQGDYGSDVINGNAGNDVLTGGFGYDVFAFTGPVTFASLGTDTITDFENGIDVIDLSGLTGPPDPAVGIASLQITDVAGVGVKVAFAVDPTVSFIVKGVGVTAASLTAADFIF